MGVGTNAIDEAGIVKGHTCCSTECIGIIITHAEERQRVGARVLDVPSRIAIVIKVVVGKGECGCDIEVQNLDANALSKAITGNRQSL